MSSPLFVLSMTESEKLVYELSQQSFMPIWSFANPLNEQSKELCDVLVVCDPDVIIFSVKDIKYKNTGRPAIDCERWHKAAVDESCKQLYGAERKLQTLSSIISSDGSRPYNLPDASRRKIHRIAVALGGHGRVPLTFGDFGKGFVHVLDEHAIRSLLGHLDTVTDFVSYLEQKLALFSNTMTMFSSEEDLLAFYVSNGDSFPELPTDIILGENLWTSFQRAPEFQALIEERRVSYAVDGILERIHTNFTDNNYRTAWAQDEKELCELELAARTLAREDRVMRVEIGKRIVDLLDRTPRVDTRARVFCARTSPIRYVFMTAPYNGNRELSFKELQARCLVARGLDHSKTCVVGILIERVDEHDGDAVSMVYIDVSGWTDEWQQKMDLYQYELGFFKNSKRTAG